MARSGQDGYTIIEVSLFLAISGLLFLIAMTGVGVTITNLRFTDSGKSLHAFVQKKYDDIITGVNSRDSSISCNGGVLDPSPSGTQNPGTSNCFVLGKLITFTEGDHRINIRNILGTEPANVNISQADEELVKDYNPVVISGVGEESFQIPWQAYISGIKRLSDNESPTNLALIRSPKSTRVLSYTYESSSTLTEAVNAPSTNLGKTTNYCISSADNLGRLARLTITNATNQSAAEIHFDVSEGDCVAS